MDPSEDATASRVDAALREALDRAAARRVGLEPALAACAEGLTEAARTLAGRFAAGARLFALGSGASAPDADHVSVEFAHPVIVGKRALPAFSLLGPAAALGGPEHGSEGFARALRRLAAPGDVALGLSLDGNGQDVSRALEAGRALGLATVALSGGDGGELAKSPAVDHALVVGARDALLVQEGHVSLYHLLWDQVQLLLEEGERAPRPLRSESAALYPFLGPREGAGGLSAALRESTEAKLRDLAALRRESFARNAGALLRGARLLARSFSGSGELLAFGNGGSATDAGAAVRLLTAPPWGRPARARSLAAEPALLLALANDVGFEVVFSRQVAAFGRRGDCALGFSTSGGSENVLRALAEARRRGLATLGFAGYDGGRMAQEGALDALLVVPSDSVHRIQEVQRSLLHALWELTQVAGRGGRPCAS